MRNDNNTSICNHGYLARSCYICELELALGRRDALLQKILKASDAEFKAWLTAQVAKENYSNPEPDVNAHEQAKTALYDAINDARRELSARIESELKG